MIWLLHGAVGSASDWEGIADALSKEGEICRAVDLWRFLECEGLSLTDWASAFNAEVEAFGAESNIIAGYSMGGRLAFHALLDRPELWKGAVIVSAHPGLESEHECLERMAGDAEWAGLALTSDWQAFLAKWNAQAVLAGPAMVSGDQLVNRRRAIARSFMEWSLGKQDDLADRLRGLEVPVLWTTGARDEKFTKLAAAATEGWPSARHEILPDCGHRVPWEDPETWVSQVRVWMEQHGLA